MKPTLRVSTEALCSQPFLTNARSEDLTRRHPVVRIKIAGIKWMLVPSKFLNKHGFYLCKPSPIVGSLLASKNVLRYDTTRGMNVFSGRFSHQETCSLHLPLFPSHPSQAGHSLHRLIRLEIIALQVCAIQYLQETLCKITSYWMITCDDIPLKFAAYSCITFIFQVGVRLWISAACVTSVKLTGNIQASPERCTPTVGSL